MNRQLIFIGIFILVLGGTAYIWYQYSQSISVPEASVAQDDFSVQLSELRRLKNLELDTSIMDDSFFRSLDLPPGVQEQSVTQREVSGRANPFISF